MKQRVTAQQGLALMAHQGRIDEQACRLQGIRVHPASWQFAERPTAYRRCKVTLHSDMVKR
ncbi:hypothetical protein [Pigmentiphaga litoralis]|uniref:hypothetical protein n=1 Tax=Pigmentiphaga litoralis TaxID=516702 RepID=UPI0016775843|nr:hypothetical protein [Pigmentiphaga litoralis]